ETGFTGVGGHSFPVPLHASGRSQPTDAERQTGVLFASSGQAVVEPSQDSAGSQAPAEERQTLPLPLTLSAGQASFVPSQDSATSQAPAAERQTAVLFPSGGHAALVPVQCSTRSHVPADDRQTTLPGWSASAGQSGFVPSHDS